MQERPSTLSWRLPFVLGASLVIVGRLRHPRGLMEAMLVDSAWIPSHAAMFVGFVILLSGLVRYRRALPLPEGTRRWATFAIWTGVLQAVQMFVHMVSNVDAIALQAGEATPMLTTHLWMATIVNPLFALAVVGLALAGVRERTFGSPWIVWLGIAGAVGHGAVMWLVFVLELGRFTFLFPLVIVLALWFGLVGMWPLPGAATAEASESLDTA